MEEDAVPDLVDLSDLQLPLGDVRVEEAVVVFREYLKQKFFIRSLKTCCCKTLEFCKCLIQYIRGSLFPQPYFSPVGL